MSVASRHTNRLANETSPYLLQHQHNPVDWYAWGPEAFEAARSQNKPIFLSVGYSTCYWCHVMERECFEQEAIAAVMNRHFINIKVDREERPDVDQLYMTAVQVMTHQGGWPMSVWLTPDLKPFYGGTYFPPDDRYGRPGFPRLLEALAEAWRDRRGEIDASASQMARVVAEVSGASAKSQAGELDVATIDRLVRRSADDYEPRFGGFGRAPKFPRQTLLRLLLAWVDLQPANSPDRARIGRQLRHTLEAMANGGIRDHLGGGFHRYSTDERWLVPHFEIMLYDQAMLAPIYARAARILEESRFADVARDICDFVLREMTGEHGEFFTAFDAEVDHREGLNYLWTPQQVEEVLGKSDAERFNALYGLSLGPNFADPHHGNGEPDQNILYLPEGPTNESDPDIITMRLKLRAARAKRKQPLLDTKVITSWNGLMIEGLAVVARELSERSYADAAARCATFLLTEHLREDGTLYRVSRDGTKKYDGFLDDYAFLAAGLVELHLTTRDIRWRKQADAVTGAMMRLFSDLGTGGFFFTASTATDLIARQKTATDSPLPSGNAAAACALHGLGSNDVAQAAVNAFSAQLQQYGESMSALLEVAMKLAAPAIAPDVAIPAATTPRIGAPSVVALTAIRAGERRIEASVIIDPRYHLHDTNEDPKLGLHATRLRVGGAHADLVDFIDYPPAQLLQLSHGPPIAAYTGNVVISVTFVQALPEEPIELSLSFQACDEATCLRPAVITTSV